MTLSQKLSTSVAAISTIVIPPTATHSRTLDRLLTEAETAAFLNVSQRTLQSWRLRGGGPVWRRLGRRSVRYAIVDLDAFIASSARNNSSEAEDVQ